MLVADRELGDSVSTSSSDGVSYSDIEEESEEVYQRGFLK
jgi:hypothetical protein